MLSQLTKNDRSLHEVVADFIFNGILGLTLYFVLTFTFLWFSPTSWYFEYTSVEPFTVPAFIANDYIEMQSTLRVNQDGNLAWNDILRCLNQETGRFDFVGEHDTRSSTVLETDGIVLSKWKYRGEMPNKPSLCRMDSTITRTLDFGIKKKQFIQSSVFEVK